MSAKKISIDRESARAINPLIGQDAAETMKAAAELIRDFGYFVSISEGESSEVRLGNLYLCTLAIAAALEYEAGESV